LKKREDNSRDLSPKAEVGSQKSQDGKTQDSELKTKDSNKSIPCGAKGA
jgi:hypothetical protein